MNESNDHHYHHSGFAGFERPTSNFFRMPNYWTDICAGIDNLAELKVVQYILRHSWGYQEYDLLKHITVDEFIRGRKRRDGSRLDRGTGLSEQSVRNGLAGAKSHGWIEEFVDDSDKARIRKSYRLRMRLESPEAQPDGDDGPAQGTPQRLGSEVQTLDPEVNGLDPGGPEIRPRSEKDTETYTFESDSGSMIETSMGDRPSASPKPVTLKVAVAITEISHKLGDEAHLGSNKAQAMNLFLVSGLNEDRFVQELFEALALTRDEVNRRRYERGAPIGKPMAYFFTVVRKQLGLPTGEKGAQT